ncbi:MAG: prenyltransferase/squalene oxidase repeat-containing protein, partial [Planctomycetota bacterium]
GAPIPAGLIGPETEEAIERGLQYLAGRQNQDGSWSLQGHGEPVILRSDTAATGLCLLSFQGAGYTHKQHQYANVVAKGIQWMVDNQREDGFLYVSENKLSDANVGLYSHGIAALALCEAYGMTQDPELMDPAQRALDFIEKSQHPKRGGWRYTPGISADTSVSGWMMMACKSGDLAGLRVSERTYDGMKLWLSKAQQSAGRPDRYRYNPNAPNTPSQKHGLVATKAMTSVGILMRMYLGWRRDNPNMQSAADFLAEAPPQNGTKDRPRRDTYYWYYATQVMFHMGGEHWENWNRYLNPLLLQSQVEQGEQAGSWDPEYPVRDRWSRHAGRLYLTTLNLLSLEVYYRHLPIYEDTAR